MHSGQLGIFPRSRKDAHRDCHQCAEGFVLHTITPCQDNVCLYCYCLLIHPFLSLSQTERDVSVRQRAADLLYAMCDRSNAKQIVAEMLSYLETADYSIREEMVCVSCSALGQIWFQIRYKIICSLFRS